MLSQEENNLITHTGCGTPGGNLLRRHWHPVALVAELPSDGAPLPVKVMSEDLVLFRGNDGQLGLIGQYCSHRRADLSYGRVEDGGLRCLYHGWLFDRKGRCIEQPCEPPDRRFCEKVRHPAYPCQERAGAIFAYMGPGEPPLLPNYAAGGAPAGHVLVSKFYHECNFFQARNEGNLDPSHVSYLHRQANVPDNLKRTVTGSDGKLPLALYDADMAPRIDAEETDYGVRIFSLRDVDGRTFFRVTNYVFTLTRRMIPGPMSGDGYNSLAGMSPSKDDTHHWRYDFVFRRSAPMEQRDIERDQEILDELGPGYRPKRNKSNRYLQDREAMKSWSFSGMGRTSTSTMSPSSKGAARSLTAARNSSALVKAIIVARRQLLRAIRDVEAGREGPHLIREPDANRFPQLTVECEVLAPGADWQEHWQERLKTLR